jgi:hypothetical protein
LILVSAKNNEPDFLVCCCMHAVQPCGLLH